MISLYRPIYTGNGYINFRANFLSRWMPGCNCLIRPKSISISWKVSKIGLDFILPMHLKEIIILAFSSIFTFDFHWMWWFTQGSISLKWLAWKRKRGTWCDGKSAVFCRCRCLPCGFESRLVQDFQRNMMFLPSQYWDIVSMLCHWARHLTLKSCTWLRWKWVPGMTEMTMCMISSMRRNGCRTVDLSGVEMAHK